MLDSDCHYFLGGSGDEDDLIGFPGMWPPDVQHGSTDEDRRDEYAKELLKNLPIDVVVATALLLFGLWR